MGINRDMSLEQIIFILNAGLILGSALMVVTARKLIHAALWLVVSLFGVAALFALLQASFLAVVQVVVYIGAIAVLFIFAVMLTRKEMMDQGPRVRSSWWIAALLAMLLLAGLTFLIIAQPDVNRVAQAIPSNVDTLRNLANALVAPDAYVLPFEVASILLLAALVGSIYVAIGKKS